jgi:hypothetical protein
LTQGELVVRQDSADTVIVLSDEMTDESRLALIDLDVTADGVRGMRLRWDDESKSWRAVGRDPVVPIRENVRQKPSSHTKKKRQDLRETPLSLPKGIAQMAMPIYAGMSFRQMFEIAGLQVRDENFSPESVVVFRKPGGPNTVNIHQGMTLRQAFEGSGLAVVDIRPGMTLGQALDECGLIPSGIDFFAWKSGDSNNEESAAEWTGTVVQVIFP